MSTDPTITAAPPGMPNPPSAAQLNDSRAGDVGFFWADPPDTGGAAIVGHNLYVDHALQLPVSRTTYPPVAPAVVGEDIRVAGAAVILWRDPVDTGNTDLTGFNIYIDGVPWVNPIEGGGANPSGLPGVPIDITEDVSVPGQATISWLNPDGTTSGGPGNTTFTDGLSGFDIYIDDVLQPGGSQ